MSDDAYERMTSGDSHDGYLLKVRVERACREFAARQGAYKVMVANTQQRGIDQEQKQLQRELDTELGKLGDEVVRRLHKQSLSREFVYVRHLPKRLSKLDEPPAIQAQQALGATVVVTNQIDRTIADVAPAETITDTMSRDVKWSIANQQKLDSTVINHVRHDCQVVGGLDGCLHVTGGLCWSWTICMPCQPLFCCCRHTGESQCYGSSSETYLEGANWVRRVARSAETPLRITMS